MNEKEIGEIRRRVRRERSNMTSIYGCYVNTQKEIIAEFKQSIGMMPENESEKYFALLKRTLSGGIGKNLLDITFRTSQVADSPEHKLLMDLRESRLENKDARFALYRKIIDSASMQENYLILLGIESYDVPFKSKDDTTQEDASGEVFTYFLCAICPVKEAKSNLRYVAENKEFHDGGLAQVVAAPEMGFMFPTFDGRATNIYNALFYTHSPKAAHEELIESIFAVKAPKCAADQKKSFDAVLTTALGEDCSMDVVQIVHDNLYQSIQMHKESKVADPLLIGKSEIGHVLQECAVEEKSMAKFNVAFDEAFGHDAQLHPKNLINNNKLEITTPDVVIKVNPERSDLVETRVIGGVKYILICADENVEVNGVNIHIKAEN